MLFSAYNLKVSLMLGVVAAFFAGETVLHVKLQLGFSSALLTALWARDGMQASFVVLVEFGMTGEDGLASLTLEMITLQMFCKRGLIGSIKVTAGLQTVSMPCRCLSKKTRSVHISQMYSVSSDLRLVFSQCSSRSS